MSQTPASPFGDPQNIDIMTRSPDRGNGVDLLLLERPGEWSDTERADALAQKLEYYQSFVFRGEVAGLVPGAQLRDVLIRVLLLRPATAEMMAIDTAGHEGVAKVVFEDQNAFRAAMNAPGAPVPADAAPRRPWWKLW